MKKVSKMYWLMYVGIISIFQFISGDVNVYLKTSDGVWGSFLGEQKTIVCHSSKYPLSSCDISLGTQNITSESNLRAGQCKATYYVNENNENQFCSCQIRFNDKIYSSGRVRMKVLNDRAFPPLQVDRLLPDSTQRRVEDSNVELVKQPNLSLYCWFPASYKETMEEYYLRWTVKVLRDNEIIPGRRFGSTTETMLVNDNKADISLGSVLNLTFNPAAYVTLTNATCALHHTSFGDKSLLSKEIKITQKYPSSLVRIANSSKLWVSKGNNIRLMCNADGNPDPAFRWVKKITRTQSEEIPNGVGQFLELSINSSNDEGNYACRARNSQNPPNNWIESDEITIYVNGASSTVVMNMFIFIISSTFLVY